MKKTMVSFKRVLISLIFVGIWWSIGFGAGATGNIKIQPYITVYEEFNDNIDLTSRNQKSDFITTISPEIKMSGSDKTYGLDFDYKAGFVFYSTNTEYNYISHLGKLNAFYRLNPKWTVRIKDDFVQSQEPLEGSSSMTMPESQPYSSINRGRAVYSRNIVEPSVEYQFGKEDRVSLAYRNNMYQTQNQLSQNSQENAVKMNLTYWLNIKNGITFDYSYAQGDFERSPDLISHSAIFRYTYRLNPRTSFFGEYAFQANELNSPGIDYIVHNPLIGIDHAFTQTLSGSAQFGYFWKNSDSGTASGYTYRAGLAKKTQRTTYLLYVQGGYSQDYFTPENLGFIQYHKAEGKITYQPIKRIVLGFSGWLESVESESKRKDLFWGISGQASYQLYQWLDISLEISHRLNDSNVDFYSFEENKAIVKITATY